MTVKHAIPTIDIGPWLSQTATQEAKDNVVRQVRDACSTYGFFNLVGHGVPTQAMKQAWEASKTFFKLPLEDKMKVSVDKSLGKSFRGYEPSLIQTHQDGLLPDTKEVSDCHVRLKLLGQTHCVQCFITGAETPADHPDAGSFSTGPNLWPTALPDEQFHDRVMEYRHQMTRLVENIVQILARGLPKEWGHSSQIFDDLTVNPSIPMRLLHYAAQKNIDPRQFGGTTFQKFPIFLLLL